MRFLHAISLLALATIACRRQAPAQPSPGRLVQLHVLDRSDAAEDDVLDEQALGARAIEDIRKARVMEVALGAEPRTNVDYRLDVQAAFSHTRGREQGVLRALVVARLVRIGASDIPILSQALAERAYGPGPLVGGERAAERAHITRALDDVLHGLAAKLRLHNGDAGTIIRTLSVADTDLRAEAVRVAGLRRERRAVPALCELLKQSKDADLRDLALGALVEIGDPSAVATLTRVVRFQDMEQLPKVLDAVAALGGDEARAYLEFVAKSHEHTAIRELAQEALERMSRRQTRIGEKPDALR